MAAASRASAATEVGNNCVADGSETDAAVLQLSQAPGATLPLAA
jgi:hypothetical protein